MRIYKLLLHLYPRSFRADYGAEMIAIFARRRLAASGLSGSVLIWISAATDVVVNAARLHADLLRQDLRYAVRSLSRARGFTATTVLVAALGIGATTAAFSLADHVLLRALPFDRADRLVRLWQDQSFRGYARMEQSPANYLDWRRMATSFDGMSAYAGSSVNVVGEGDPERLQGSAVSVDLFSTLRVQAALGRALTSIDEPEGSPRVVVLSHRLWQTKFGAGSVLGRSIVMNDVPHVIVGVMPAWFEFPSRTAEYWVPLQFSAGMLSDRTDAHLNLVARLRDDVTIDQARSEMQVVAGQLERAYPKENAKTGATVLWLRDQVDWQSRMLLIGLVGASVCMLLIACTNLANLLLARGLARRTDLAVRAAMGAGRERLIRQNLTESLVIVGAGGLLGVLVAVVALPVISRLVPTSLPISETPSVDLRMLSATALLTIITGLIVGVVPALATSRGTNADALREGARAGTTRTTERLRSSLVVAAVAASVVLLISSGLLVRALWRVQQIDPGFRTANVLTLRTALSGKYNTTVLRQQFFDRVLGEVKALPGVTGAAYISYLPMVMRGGIWPVILDSARLTPEQRANWAPDPGETRMASFRFTTPGFFAATGVPLVRGRDVSDADTADSPAVAVVSQSFADQMWPGEDPIGRTFFMAFRERTIVGVAGTIRVRGLEQESEPQVYVPSRQQADRMMLGYAPKDLVVAATVPMASLVPAVRAIIASVDPQQPISDVRMLADIVDADSAPRQVQVRVLGGLAAIAFLLAGVGIHGLLAFAVSSRTREIGLRIALGARSGEIVGMVMRRGLLLAGVGVLVGVVAGVAVGRALQAMLAGVSPLDPVTFAGAAALAVLMTTLGSLLPALRALRVDPVIAMRET